MVQNWGGTSIFSASTSNSILIKKGCKNKIREGRLHLLQSILQSTSKAPKIKTFIEPEFKRIEATVVIAIF